MRRKATRWWIGILAAALAGCGDDFQPVSLLADLRVLAIEATPLELAPGEAVQLRPVVFVPAGQQIAAHVWSFCPFSLGPSAEYACVAAECNFALGAGADGALVANPSALAAECAARLGGNGAAGVPAELPDVVQVTFSYRVTSDGGEVRDAVLTLDQYTREPPTARNRAPVVAGWTVADQALQPGDSTAAVSAGAEVTVELAADLQSLDPLPSPDGTAAVEEALWSVYTTAGRLDAARAAGEIVELTWKAEKLEPGQNEALLYAALRDGRGGVTVSGPVRIPIANP